MWIIEKGQFQFFNYFKILKIVIFDSLKLSKLKKQNIVN